MTLLCSFCRLHSFAHTKLVVSTNSWARVFWDPSFPPPSHLLVACGPSSTWELLISDSRLRNPMAISPRWLIITWVETSVSKGRLCCAGTGWVGLKLCLVSSQTRLCSWAKVLGLDAGWDVLLDCPLRCFEREEINY